MGQVDDLIESRTEYVVLACLSAILRKHQISPRSGFEMMESRFASPSNNCKKTATHSSIAGNREDLKRTKYAAQSNDSGFFTDDYCLAQLDGQPLH
jgi:hypothetical protein